MKLVEERCGEELGERGRGNYHKHNIYKKNLVFIKGKRKKKREISPFETDYSISI